MKKWFNKISKKGGFMNKIDIYTSSTCPYCVKAKKLLQMLKLDYTEHNVDDCFDNMCEELSVKYNKTVQTVPQIIINENYVGGYTDLESIYKSGKLNEVLN